MRLFYTMSYLRFFLNKPYFPYRSVASKALGMATIHFHSLSSSASPNASQRKASYHTGYIETQRFLRHPSCHLRMINQSLPICGPEETSTKAFDRPLLVDDGRAIIALFINPVHNRQMLMIVCALSKLCKF